MSEAGINPAFNPEDITINASENDVSFGPQTEIIAITEKLDFINPAIYSPYEMVSERRLAAIRRSWLEEADQLYRDGNYMAAISLLNDVVNDIEISRDHTHIESLNSIIDHCWQRIDKRVGKSAVHKIIESPYTEHPLAS